MKEGDRRDGEAVRETAGRAMAHRLCIALSICLSSGTPARSVEYPSPAGRTGGDAAMSARAAQAPNRSGEPGALEKGECGRTPSPIGRRAEFAAEADDRSADAGEPRWCCCARKAGRSMAGRRCSRSTALVSEARIWAPSPLNTDRSPDSQGRLASCPPMAFRGETARSGRKAVGFAASAPRS